MNDAGRMWIRTIEEGTTYGALSASGDIVIINDYYVQDKEDVDYHFAAVNLGSIRSKEVQVVELDTGLIMFMPKGTTTGGVWGGTLSPIGLPSLEGIMESQSKQVIESVQMEAVMRSFEHVAAKYTCVPISLGSTLYMTFMAKGKKWDMTVLCRASKTTKSVLDAISAGWISGSNPTIETLNWNNIPKPVRKIMAQHLGIVKKRYESFHEKKLLGLSATKVFKGLPLETIYSIGKVLGIKKPRFDAHDVLKALQKKK